MRRPPSPVMLPAYPVTGGISLMAIAVTLMTWSRPGTVARFVVTASAFHREPWRLLISALPHLDIFHLLFDLSWFWVFGTLVEEVLGSVRLFGLIVLFSAGSMAAEFAFSRGGLGLSGVGYGLFGMLWILSRSASRPRPVFGRAVGDEGPDPRFADGVDRRTVELMIFWFFFCIVLTVIKVWAVANVAHGVGLLLGMLVGAAMSARVPWRRTLAALGVPAVMAASFASATVLRPYVNVSRDGSESFQLGYQAIQDGRFEDGIRHYRDSVAMEPRKASAWYNLGIAYESAFRNEEAAGAFRRAWEIEPLDSRHRGAVLESSWRLAREAFKRGDDEKVAAMLRGIVEVSPDDGDAWSELAACYGRLGKAAEAEDARQRAARAKPKTPQP